MRDLDLQVYSPCPCSLLQAIILLCLSDIIYLIFPIDVEGWTAVLKDGSPASVPIRMSRHQKEVYLASRQLEPLYFNAPGRVKVHLFVLMVDFFMCLVFLLNFYTC